ncbi:MAG: hypothetical protein WBE32_15345, partial [Pseudolabrys sp.]
MASYQCPDKNTRRFHDVIHSHYFYRHQFVAFETTFVEQLARLRVVSFGREPGEDIMKIVFFSLFARPILLVACVR